MTSPPSPSFFFPLPFFLSFFVRKKKARVEKEMALLVHLSPFSLFFFFFSPGPAKTKEMVRRPVWDRPYPLSFLLPLISRLSFPDSTGKIIANRRRRADPPFFSFLSPWGEMVFLSFPCNETAYHAVFKEREGCLSPCALDRDERVIERNP